MGHILDDVVVVADALVLHDVGALFWSTACAEHHKDGCGNHRRMRHGGGSTVYLPRYLAIYYIARLVAGSFISAAAPFFATAINFWSVAGGIWTLSFARLKWSGLSTSTLSCRYRLMKVAISLPTRM